MDLRPRSHINHYFTPMSLSYRKLPTYVDAYKHYYTLCTAQCAGGGILEHFFLLYKIII